MSRREFSAAVKRAAWERCGGRCEGEGCGVPFTAANPPEYDHRIEDALGGEPTLENCAVLGRKCCHRKKSSERAPVIAKAHRVARKVAGLAPRKRKLPGAKDGPWKAKIGGGWVRRDEE